uniref:Uncharacterized protein n=1 Tax=Populus trichocarpa TaxID=3694 RepID=A0A2K1WZV5_POPTR
MWSQDCTIPYLGINREPQKVGKALIFNHSSFLHEVPPEPNNIYSGYNNWHHSYLRSCNIIIRPCHY